MMMMRPPWRLSLLQCLLTLHFRKVVEASWCDKQSPRPFACVSCGSQKPRSKRAYGRIAPDQYRLTPEQIEAFHMNGCITIPDLLTEEEVDPLVHVFELFVEGNISAPGKDFCDMSQPFGTPYSNWSLVNCMLPRRYYPDLQNNIYESLTANLASQLFPGPMRLDYDQFLNKRPGRTDAVFAWHQDMAYWPDSSVLGTNNTGTCTFSLALDDSDEANGCLRFVPGSHLPQTLWPHRPVNSNRSVGHALVVADEVDETTVRLAPARRGSVTVHNEYVIHGSGGNSCVDRQRRTYVVAYRAKETVEAERSKGFTHSHNDDVNWDTFHQHDGKRDRLTQ